MYRQYIEGVNISLEKGTENVPNDDRYHILKNSEIIFSHKNEKIAMMKFAEYKPKVKNKNKSQSKDKKSLLGNENADRLIGQQASERINEKFKKGGRKGLN